MPGTPPYGRPRGAVPVIRMGSGNPSGSRKPAEVVAIDDVLEANAALMREIDVPDASTELGSEGQQPPQASDVAPDVGATATRREIS